MIFFEPISHTYRLDNPETGELCVSATTLLELFKKPFNSDFWSLYTGLRYALKMEKKEFSSHLAKNYYFNFKETQENKDRIYQIAASHGVFAEDLEFFTKIALSDWKYENDISKDKGTDFHNFKEDEIYKNNGLEYDGVYSRVASQTDDLSLLHDPLALIIAPELRMYNRRYKISGTADKVFIFPNKVIDIDDWKTNKEIKQTSYKGKTTMIGPLKHLQDCNYVHYCLQVSLYAWMLEQYGYTPRKLKFTHVILDPLIKNKIIQTTEYHTHYMKYEVESMLKYFDLHKDELLAAHKLKKK